MNNGISCLEVFLLLEKRGRGNMLAYIHSCKQDMDLLGKMKSDTSLLGVVRRVDWNFILNFTNFDGN